MILKAFHMHFEYVMNSGFHKLFLWNKIIGRLQYEMFNCPCLEHTYMEILERNAQKERKKSPWDYFFSLLQQDCIEIDQAWRSQGCALWSIVPLCVINGAVCLWCLNVRSCVCFSKFSFMKWKQRPYWENRQTGKVCAILCPQGIHAWPLL